MISPLWWPGSEFIFDSLCSRNLNLVCYSSAEEAGFYLATYKQFEHKPPDLIKERVDKDYHSMLRTALTSINKVNKTDVETLRTSFGVSVPYITALNILLMIMLASRASLASRKLRLSNFRVFPDLGRSRSKEFKTRSPGHSESRRRTLSLWLHSRNNSLP